MQPLPASDHQNKRGDVNPEDRPRPQSPGVGIEDGDDGQRSQDRLHQRRPRTRRTSRSTDASTVPAATTGKTSSLVCSHTLSLTGLTSPATRFRPDHPYTKCSSTPATKIAAPAAVTSLRSTPHRPSHAHVRPSVRPNPLRQAGPVTACPPACARRRLGRSRGDAGTGHRRRTCARPPAYMTWLFNIHIQRYELGVLIAATRELRRSISRCATARQ